MFHIYDLRFDVMNTIKKLRTKYGLKSPRTNLGLPTHGRQRTTPYDYEVPSCYGDVIT